MEFPPIYDKFTNLPRSHCFSFSHTGSKNLFLEQIKHFSFKMKTPYSPEIIITHKSVSEQLLKITKPILEKDLTFKLNSKLEHSPFFKPILSNYKSEITINKNFETVEKNSDSQLIPTPKTPKNPQENLRKSLMKLKSVHWNESVLALRDIIQISRFHPHLLTKSMPAIYKGIIAMLKSLRMNAARTACQAANELFMNMPCDQGEGFDDLVHVLLQKTADTNKNVREDALEALNSMVIHVSPAQSIKALLHRRIAGCTLNIRITASKLLACVLGDSDTHSATPINEDMKIKLVFAAVRFLQDHSYDIKFHGMRLFTMLMEHKDFQNIFQTKITDDLLRQVLSIIERVKSPKRHPNM